MSWPVPLPGQLLRFQVRCLERWIERNGRAPTRDEVIRVTGCAARKAELVVAGVLAKNKPAKEAQPAA